MTGMTISEMEEMARKCRIEICKMTHRAQAGHPGGSLSEIDILCGESDPLSLGSHFGKHSVVKVSWLSDCYVAIPKDRSYFGSLTDFGSDNYAILIHNPSRGIAFSL